MCWFFLFFSCSSIQPNCCLLIDFYRSHRNQKAQRRKVCFDLFSFFARVQLVFIYLFVAFVGPPGGVGGARGRGGSGGRGGFGGRGMFLKKLNNFEVAFIFIDAIECLFDANHL